MYGLRMTRAARPPAVRFARAADLPPGQFPRPARRLQLRASSARSAGGQAFFITTLALRGLAGAGASPESFASNPLSHVAFSATRFLPCLQRH